MSETVTINSRETLSGIVQQKYHLKGWSNIQAKCEEIKLFNNQNNTKYQVKDIGKILAGQTLVLPDDTDTAEKPEETNLGKKFDDWTESCADSLTGEVDENKEPTYKHDVSPFNMARTPEFKAAVKAEDYDKANDVYRENFDALAGSIVDNADTDGDGELSVQEFKQKEFDDTEKKIAKLSPEQREKLGFDAPENKDGKLSQEQRDNLSGFFVRQFLMMDLDTPENVKPEEVKDLRITKKEYAAFLKALDGNNKENTANGELTRDEYLGMTKILEGNDNKALLLFKKKERDSYKSLYDPEPAK